jgi:hypothetical protein
MLHVVGRDHLILAVDEAHQAVVEHARTVYYYDGLVGTGHPDAARSVCGELVQLDGLHGVTRGRGEPNRREAETLPESHSNHSFRTV